MKVLVPIKRVADADARIRVHPDGQRIQSDGIQHVINPFDAVALEEAIRMKERGAVTEIVVVTIGAAECAEQLRIALAMGADRALLVSCAQEYDPFSVASVLAAVYRSETPGLVIMGKQAIDDDSCQAGQMLAGLLGIAQVTFVSKVVPEGARLRCTRETDDGTETLLVALPAVVTADLRLNEPRYVSMPGLLRAKRKIIEQTTPKTLGVKIDNRTTVLKLESPPQRKQGVFVKSVDELLAKLRDEAKVLE